MDIRDAHVIKYVGNFLYKEDQMIIVMEYCEEGTLD